MMNIMPFHLLLLLLIFFFDSFKTYLYLFLIGTFFSCTSLNRIFIYSSVTQNILSSKLFSQLTLFSPYKPIFNHGSFDELSTSNLSVITTVAVYTRSVLLKSSDVAVGYLVNVFGTIFLSLLFDL